MAKIYPMIMCGGAGTRLWPLSVAEKPKQFHALITDRSLLTETVARADAAAGLELAAPGFICALDAQDQVRADCAAAGYEPRMLILEPCARNTAPVTAMAALELAERDPDGLILLLPADHHIEDAAGFWAAVNKGVDAARSGRLVTFGIKPTRPETGYGYIEAGAGQDGVVDVARFVEKPDEDTAQRYLSSGSFFWNAGIFLFSPRAMLDAFAAHAPDMLAACRACYAASLRQGESLYLDAASFAAVPSDSIDYAIMERADNVSMVCPVDIGWTDIGSWQALSDHLRKGEGNALQGNVIALDCAGSFIRSDGPLVGAYGLKDMIVIATGDAVLVIPAEQSQNVKAIVAELKSRK